MVNPHLFLVSHNYAPEPTGIPLYNTGMAEWLVRQGWRVTVLTGMPHYPWWRVPVEYADRDYRQGQADEVINGVMVRRVRHFVPHPPVSGKNRIRLDASYLRQWLQRTNSLGQNPADRPDVIVGVAPPFLIGGLLLRLRSRFQAPVVYHAQDLQVDAALDLGMLPSWMGGVLRQSERWQLKRMDLVTACGQGMLRRIAGKVPLHLRPRHWPNWADCQTMRPWSDAEGPNPQRASLDHGRPETRVVLYSGNLGRKQGLEGLIQALGVIGQHPHLRTVIAGAGAERTNLEHQLRDSAIGELQDLRPPDQLRAFLAAADLHVIPQKREAADLVLPSKLLNILAVGRPVVVTAEPGTELAEVVLAAGAGLVVPPEDPQALAAALCSLASDPERRATMGASGRRWIEAHLGIDAVLGRIERDLRGLIRAHGAR